MNQRMSLTSLVSVLLLATTLSVSTQAADKQDTPPKRPATAKECDPSNWVIDPAVDYSVCEEASTRPRQ